MNMRIKTFTKNSTVAVLVISLAVAAFGFIGSTTALAATTPSLGAVADYAIVSDTWTNTLNAGLETAITGDVCYTTPPGTAPVSVSGATVVPCPSEVGTAQSTLLADLNAQVLDSCTSLGTNVVLSGTYTPGCYSSSGTMDITLSTTVTLDGAGTYIFKSGGEITTGQDSIVTLTGGADASDVFWIPTGGALSLGANSATSATPTFVGTIIADALGSNGVNLGHFANLLGRVLAFGHTVTTDSNTIIVPTTASAPTSSGPSTGTINVVKNVVNDSGGTKVVSDFSLFVNSTPVTSGVTYTFAAPSSVFTVTETGNSGYATVFSGDCDVNGQFNLNGGENKFCIVTNNDIGAPAPVIPPLIDVVKVPSPLALPNGPGPVTYNYTLTNIGEVPVTDITMVGDTCSPITRVSGDVNGDNKLDVSETWIYTCSTTLSETHTNIVTTTGWANGISAVDVAAATVVVGVPGLPETGVVPPLIHVTKIPSPLALFSAGGMVTYTNKVTNPGTVALNNVYLTDDKCSPLSYLSGDINSDSMLDTNETWMYTCSTNLTTTTTNTVMARGEANGLVARDFAIATVVVAAPGLPSTGIAPDDKSSVLWNFIVPLGVLVALFSLYLIRRKQTA